MRNKRWQAFGLAVIMTAVPVYAQTTVVHQLGVSPLIGTISSTPELRDRFREDQPLFREAGTQIGLSPAEYRAFKHKLETQKPGWGAVPRHLDAMAWASGGQVYALHDLEIPAGVNGWEVDLRERHQLVSIYIPMICGNLSVVRHPVKNVAVVRPPLPPRHIFAAAPPPPAAVPAPQPLVAAESPATEIPPVATPIVHHPHLLLPILAAAAAAILLTNHHGGGTSMTYQPGSTNIIAPPPLPTNNTVTPPTIPVPVVPIPTMGPAGPCSCTGHHS